MSRIKKAKCEDAERRPFEDDLRKSAGFHVVAENVDCHNLQAEFSLKIGHFMNIFGQKQDPVSRVALGILGIDSKCVEPVRPEVPEKKLKFSMKDLHEFLDRGEYLAAREYLANLKENGDQTDLHHIHLFLGVIDIWADEIPDGFLNLLEAGSRYIVAPGADFVRDYLLQIQDILGKYLDELLKEFDCAKPFSPEHAFFLLISTAAEEFANKLDLSLRFGELKEFDPLRKVLEQIKNLLPVKSIKLN